MAISNNISYGYIANALKSSAADHILGVSQDIYDTSLEKYQSTVNTELYNKFNNYLPLSGGTLSGSLNLSNNTISRGGFEVVTTLPTDNLFVGRLVNYSNKLFSYNGEDWLSQVELADDLGGRPETHSEEFIFQPTANDLSIKDGYAKIKKIKGNTIVWNQVYKHQTVEDIDEIYIAYRGENTLSLSHKILLKFRYSNSDLSFVKTRVGLSVGGNTYGEIIYDFPIQVGENIQASLILTNKNANNTGFFLEVRGHDTFNTTSIDISTIQLFDLTKMFGEGNEPTIEEFEAMFPNDYYEYEKGRLINIDAVGIKSVGFNQWDEEWEVGFISPNGNNGISTINIRSKNYIPVLSNAKYFISAQKVNTAFNLFEYDSNKLVINTQRITDAKFVTSQNTKYIRFTSATDYYGTTYNNDICINLSHSGIRNGEYEPYESYTTLFSEGKSLSQLTGKLNGTGNSVVVFPEGLKGINGIYDEITKDNKGNSIAIKRIGSVDMGTLTWTYNDGSSNPNAYPYGYNEAYIYDRKGGKNNVLQIKYRNNKHGFKEDKTFNPNPNYGVIYIIDSSYTDVETFKQSLQGQILYYELANPKIYILDSSVTFDYQVRDFGTEELLITDNPKPYLPIKLDTEYGFNAVDMIRNNHFNIHSINDKIKDLNNIRQNANIAYSWGNHAEAGYAKSNDIVQSDWNETDIDSKAYIKHKPEIPGPYILPAATTNALGGFKLGFSADNTNKNYPVLLDSNSRAYVNVPWTGGSTSYELPIANDRVLGGLKTGFPLQFSTDYGLFPLYVDSSDAEAYTLITRANINRLFGENIEVLTDTNIMRSSLSINPITGSDVADRYYGVEKSSNGKLFVNVPWESPNIPIPEYSSAFIINNVENTEEWVIDGDRSYTINSLTQSMDYLITINANESYEERSEHYLSIHNISGETVNVVFAVDTDKKLYTSNNNLITIENGDLVEVSALMINNMIILTTSNNLKHFEQ